jgi:hypothetical protein
MSQGNQCIEGLHLFSSCGGGDYRCNNKYIHALTIWKSFGATGAPTSSFLTPAFSFSRIVAPTPIVIVLVVAPINSLESIASVAYHTSQLMGIVFLYPN